MVGASTEYLVTRFHSIEGNLYCIDEPRELIKQSAALTRTLKAEVPLRTCPFANALAALTLVARTL